MTGLRFGKHFGLLLSSAVVLALLSCSAMQPRCGTVPKIGPRPAKWAVQMKGTCNVPNFYKVNDDLYRSAQPTDVGMAQLKEMGIKTIIDLRALHSDTGIIGSTGLLSERLRAKAWHIEDEDVIRVMTIISNRNNGPFLVHCQHGSDRTGVMCAMYRIICQKWEPEDAIDEMVNGGYGFHPVWTNIIDYIRKKDRCDIERLKQAIIAQAKCDCSEQDNPPAPHLAF